MKLKNLIVFTLLIFYYQVASLGQSNDNSVETLFEDNISSKYLTKPAVQFIPIQNQFAGMIGLSYGTYLNSSFYAGFSGYANLTHTKINTGVFGIEVEHVFNQNKLIHFGYNIFAGFGTVKEYQEKSNLFDNFLNIFGTGYYFAQPSILLELNYSSSIRLSFGVGYRFAAGLNENSIFVSKSHLKNNELNSYLFLVTIKLLD